MTYKVKNFTPVILKCIAIMLMIDDWSYNYTTNWYIPFYHNAFMNLDNVYICSLALFC